MELERSIICAVREDQQDASEECLNTETRSRGETTKQTHQETSQVMHKVVLKTCKPRQCQIRK